MSKFHFDNTIAKFRVARGSNQRLVALIGDSPHQRAEYALIPEASALLGDRAAAAAQAAELNARPELANGDVITVDSHTFVARRVERNSDWWRLVPVYLLRNGKRFYVDFEGMGVWKIRDAAADGRVVAWDALKQAGVGPIRSLDDAERAVDALHATHGTPEHRDYLDAIENA